MKLKREIRVVGFDDAPFEFKSKQLCPVVGPVFRGGEFMDGMLKTEVTVDGLDATEKIVKLLNSSRHKPQLRAVLFDGITLAGFNVLNIQAVHELTGLPVIAVNRKHPNLERVKKALKRFEDYEQRWKLIQRAGPLKACEVKGKWLYYQAAGVEDCAVQRLLKLTCTRSFFPEPLRVAHLIASALVKGESVGRA